MYITKLLIGESQAALDYISAENSEISKVISSLFGSSSNKITTPELRNINSLNNKINISAITKPEKSREIGLGELKNLREFVSLKPHLSKFSYIIIFEADLLNKVAQNSLLKILEEPAEYLKIYMQAENSRNILETILSRCLKIELNKPYDFNNPDDLVSRIELFSKENSQLEEIFIELVLTREYSGLIKLLQLIADQRDSLSKYDILQKISNRIEMEIYRRLSEPQDIESIARLQALLEETNKFITANVNPKLIAENMFVR